MTRGRATNRGGRTGASPRSTRIVTNTNFLKDQFVVCRQFTPDRNKYKKKKGKKKKKGASEKIRIGRKGEE